MIYNINDGVLLEMVDDLVCAYKLCITTMLSVYIIIMFDLKFVEVDEFVLKTACDIEGKPMGDGCECRRNIVDLGRPGGGDEDNS